MLRLEDVAAWLGAEHNFADYFHFGDIDRVPKGRHNLYCLTETGGFGLMTERTLDRPTFQVLTQGSGGTTALEMAYRLDSALIDTEPPLSMGNMHVVDIGRVGGPPAYVGRDDENHIVYSASYWMTIGR